MATILTKKSDTASAVPASGDLTHGSGGAELAVNTADKRIFTKNSGGTVVELGTNPSTLTVDTDTLVVDAANNRVGIGTASPTVALDISGVASANNIRATTTFQLVDSLGTARNVLQLNSDDLTIQTGTTAGARSITFLTENTERLRIDSSGNVGIGTSSPAQLLSLSSASPRIILTQTTANSNAYVDAATSGVLEFSADDNNVAASSSMRFKVDGAERMRIDSSGNVGIGTSSPAARLEISGGNAGVTDPLLSPNRLRFTDSDTTKANNQVTGGLEWYTADTDAAGVYAYISSATNSAGSGYVTFATGSSSTIAERMRIDSSGNVGIGTSTMSQKLVIDVNSSTTTASSFNGITIGNSDTTANNGSAIAFSPSGSNGNLFSRIGVINKDRTASSEDQDMFFGTMGAGVYAERMRITSAGEVLVGKTSTSLAVVGSTLFGTGITYHVADSNIPLYVNRLTNDGTLVEFRQDTVAEGTISVSGTTVSYNGGHLSRWAQTTNPKDETLVKGTVLSNLDEMNVYTDADGNTVDNEQLNKVKVSDVEGDANVAGVFVNWSYDEAHSVDEINMAMTGDMIIRIAQGVTVQRGDLLMSAGGGTAKPQGDDIVRSKTIAKVTSTHVTCTYADGSYCVPCVLMAC